VGRIIIQGAVAIARDITGDVIVTVIFIGVVAVATDGVTVTRDFRRGAAGYSKGATNARDITGVAVTVIFIGVVVARDFRRGAVGKNVVRGEGATIAIDIRGVAVTVIFIGGAVTTEFLGGVLKGFLAGVLKWNTRDSVGASGTRRNIIANVVAVAGDCCRIAPMARDCRRGDARKGRTTTMVKKMTTTRTTRLMVDNATTKDWVGAATT
jgi:hypothetical protein